MARSTGLLRGMSLPAKSKIRVSGKIPRELRKRWRCSGVALAWNQAVSTQCGEKKSRSAG